jgi:hypothetical protein
LENLGKGMIVTMVTAFDEDPGMNGMLTYSIPSNEMKQYFSIDADTGNFFSTSVVNVLSSIVIDHRFESHCDQS